MSMIKIMLRHVCAVCLVCVSNMSWGFAPPIDITVETDWKGASTQDVKAVLDSVTVAVLPYIAQRRLGKIIVRNDAEGPISYYKRGENDEYIIALDVQGPYWSQIAYQFSHEMCHLVSNYDLAPSNVSHQMWVDETLCEAFSLFTLARLADQWQTNPPYPNWREYAVEFKKYREARMQEPHRFLTKGNTLATWYQQHKTKLSDDPTANERDLDELVATDVLTLFEKEPQTWAALNYLNLGDDRKDKSLKKFLADWQENTPDMWREPIQQLTQKLIPETPSTH